MRKMLKSKKENRQRLAKSVRLKPTSSSVFITQIAVEEPPSRKSRRSERLENESNERAAVSALLQANLQTTPASQFNEERLQQFQSMRNRQRESYHKYLRE